MKNNTMIPSGELPTPNSSQPPSPPEDTTATNGTAEKRNTLEMDSRGPLNPKPRHRKGRHNRTWSCPSALTNPSLQDEEPIGELMAGVQYAHGFLNAPSTDIYNNAASVAKVLDSLSYLSNLGAESGKEKKSPTKSDQFPVQHVLTGTSAESTRRRNLSGDGAIFSAGFSAGATFNAPSCNDIHPLLRPPTQHQQTDLAQDLHSGLSNLSGANGQILDHIHPLLRPQQAADLHAISSRLKAAAGSESKVHPPLQTCPGEDISPSEETASNDNRSSEKKFSRPARKRSEQHLSTITESSNDQGAGDVHD